MEHNGRLAGVISKAEVLETHLRTEIATLGTGLHCLELVRSSRCFRTGCTKRHVFEWPLWMLLQVGPAFSRKISKESSVLAQRKETKRNFVLSPRKKEKETTKFRETKTKPEKGADFRNAIYDHRQLTL